MTLLPATHHIVGFEHQEDAQRFLVDLRGRLAKFSLELGGRWCWRITQAAGPDSGGKAI
jgi:hypothetical protein